MDDYLKQAKKLLAKANVTFKATYLKTAKHFDNDKDERDIYEIELNGHKFNFGQSLQNSGIYHILSKGNVIREVSHNKALGYSSLSQLPAGTWAEKNKNFQAPNAYDVLASLVKSNPETLDDFIAEYGYEWKTASEYETIKKTHEAVTKEYIMVLELFGKHMEELYEVA